MSSRKCHEMFTSFIGSWLWQPEVFTSFYWIMVMVTLDVHILLDHGYGDLRCSCYFLGSIALVPEMFMSKES